MGMKLSLKDGCGREDGGGEELNKAGVIGEDEHGERGAWCGGMDKSGGLVSWWDGQTW